MEFDSEATVGKQVVDVATECKHGATVPLIVGYPVSVSVRVQGGARALLIRARSKLAGDVPPRRVAYLHAAATAAFLGTLLGILCTGRLPRKYSTRPSGLFTNPLCV